MLGHRRLHGLLDPVQIVKVPGYVAGVSPGVQHLPELLSVRDLTRVHGNMLSVEAGVTEILD